MVWLKPRSLSSLRQTWVVCLRQDFCFLRWVVGQSTKWEALGGTWGGFGSKGESFLNFYNFISRSIIK